MMMTEERLFRIFREYNEVKVMTDAERAILRYLYPVLKGEVYYKDKIYKLQDAIKDAEKESIHNNEAYILQTMETFHKWYCNPTLENQTSLLSLLREIQNDKAQELATNWQKYKEPLQQYRKETLRDELLDAIGKKKPEEVYKIAKKVVEEKDLEDFVIDQMAAYQRWIRETKRKAS